LSRLNPINSKSWIQLDWDSSRNINKAVLYDHPTEESHIAGVIPKYLKYEAEKGWYFHFFYSENGEDWVPVEVDGEFQIDGTYLAQWGFSPRIGFILNSTEEDIANFSELRVDYKNFK
jgi:hypothetical protein